MTDSLQQSSPATLLVRTVSASDPGNVRAENQDFALISPLSDNSLDSSCLLIVADGMGGHRGGATASRVAAQTFSTELLSQEIPPSEDGIRAAINAANQRVFEESQENRDLAGMGTTLSALVICEGQGWIGHVGDSRIYRVRDGSITQLTEDHSLVASMVREGLLSAEEAETHPRRNVLQRSIGVALDVDIDVAPLGQLVSRDRFVLCSDGLHGVVRDAEILQLAMLPLERASSELIALAKHRGAPDNVTLILARIVHPDEKESPESRSPTVPFIAAFTDVELRHESTEARDTSPAKKINLVAWLGAALTLLVIAMTITFYANR